MSSDLDMTMDELAQESAELLPSRETLCVSKWGGHGGNTNVFSQVGYGNTAQNGAINVAVLNGSLDNILSLGSGNLL